MSIIGILEDHGIQICTHAESQTIMIISPKLNNGTYEQPAESPAVHMHHKDPNAVPDYQVGFADHIPLCATTLVSTTRIHAPLPRRLFSLVLRFSREYSAPLDDSFHCEYGGQHQMETNVLINSGTNELVEKPAESPL